MLDWPLGLARLKAVLAQFIPGLAVPGHAHAHITKVHAPHLSMVSNPGVVTRVILKAVHATG
jgi:hypothetical protein